MLLALMILGYACLGGYIFLTLEYDQQQLDLEVEKQVRLSESTLLAENLLKYLKQWNCVRFCFLQKKDCFTCYIISGAVK